MNRAPTPSPAIDADILIIGGGPVGLLLANLLGRQNTHTLLLERRDATPARSMAIGVTPPSLEILRPLGLDTELETAGVPVRNAGVHEQGELLGRLTFDGLPTAYPYFLSIPQSVTVATLRRRALRWESLRLGEQMEFIGLTRQRDHVITHARDLSTGHERELRSRYLVGCDGHLSRVREAAGISANIRHYRQRWVMGDFNDTTSLNDEAHLFFNPEGSVESFPLPGRRRRWIVQLDPRETGADPADELTRRVRELAGFELPPPVDVSTFGAKRLLAETFHRDRVLLCGDSAHVMSSIGGQGMNTGFAAAELLATTLRQALTRPEHALRQFQIWERIRRAAFNVAADRAARGMWLGTLRGRLASRLRRHIIRDILFSPLMRHRLAPHFAMLTIPNRNLAHTPPALLGTPQPA